MLFIALSILFIVAGCATPDDHGIDAIDRYGPHCEKLGHRAGSDAWTACIKTEDLNAAIAAQRALDQKLLRRLDCVDPRVACDPRSR
jgi:hypothetical protein